MSANVDYEFYYTVYMGSEADEASFPALCARASDVVGALTRWADISRFPEWVQTLYKKAVCAQVDFFAVNGLEAVAGGNDRGFTVGKVSVSGKSGSEISRKGVMADNLSPMVIMYLEQTGLMAPQVETAADLPFVGWL
jgi:hypothetical protein